MGTKKMWCFSMWKPTANAERHWVCRTTQASAKRAHREAGRPSSSKSPHAWNPKPGPIVRVKPSRETVLEYGR